MIKVENENSLLKVHNSLIEVANILKKLTKLFKADSLKEKMWQICIIFLLLSSITPTKKNISEKLFLKRYKMTFFIFKWPKTEDFFIFRGGLVRFVNLFKELAIFSTVVSKKSWKKHWVMCFTFFQLSISGLLLDRDLVFL